MLGRLLTLLSSVVLAVATSAPTLAQSENPLPGTSPNNGGEDTIDPTFDTGGDGTIGAETGTPGSSGGGGSPAVSAWLRSRWPSSWQ